MQVLTPREVPLGGLRSMTVRRTLPHRDRSFIGAWCFADHYGPDRIGVDAAGMDIPPHPHTGLQTVSWLFDGEIEHRDSAGTHAKVIPGAVNLMTGGRGIAHSEVSTRATTVLHGVQLWVALPNDARDAPRAFEHFDVPRTDLPGGAGQVRVFIGELSALAQSPIRTYTPLLGAEVVLTADAVLELSVNPAFEYGFLLDMGELTVGEHVVHLSELVCLDAGRRTIRVRAGVSGARFLLLGGQPFEEEIVMWWNFIARSHEEIASFRQEWEMAGERFGHVPGCRGAQLRIPAPALPSVRLRPRGRIGRR